MRRVQLGDIGTRFVIEMFDEDGASVDGDVDGATMAITFRRPNGSTFIRNASYLSPSSMQYTTQAGDLNAVGKWRAQGHVAVGGYDGHTSQVEFVVGDVL